MKKIVVAFLLMWIVQWQTERRAPGENYYFLDWHQSKPLGTVEAMGLIANLFANGNVDYISARLEKK